MVVRNASVENPAKTPTARPIAIPLQFPQPEYQETLFTALVPERVKATVRNMTHREIHYLGEGIKWATIANSVAWTIFLMVH